MPRTTEEEELGELKEWRWEVYPSFNNAPIGYYYCYDYHMSRRDIKCKL